MKTEKSSFVKVGKNFLFAPFNSKKEYREAYQSISKQLPSRDRFEFLVFVERIRSTILTEGRDV
tara:strand:- start:50 stop:241 length:192 start_codon:yes stop_codon:yes gene_type:complete